MMRSWIVAMIVTGMAAAGCGRESTHTDPPPGGWVDGASNAQSFSGPATPQFNFGKDRGPPTVRDAAVTDTGGAEDVGGPLILDSL